MITPGIAASLTPTSLTPTRTERGPVGPRPRRHLRVPHVRLHLPHLHLPHHHA